jgi:OmpA-OmpF porin, OOP family
MESTLDLLTSAFRGETLERLSSQLGESRGATERAIAQVLPMSLGSISAQARSEQGSKDLLGSIRRGTAPELDVAEVARVIDDPAETQRIAQSGSGFTSKLLGDKFDALLDIATRQSGVSRPSATTLFGIAAPLVLGVIGKRARARNLDAHGLSSLLAEEAQNVSGALPASFGNLFKTRDLRPLQLSPSRRAPDRNHKRRGLIWGIAGLGALATILLWRSFTREPTLAELEMDAAPPTAAMRDPTLPSPPDLGQLDPSERQTVAGTDVIRLSDDADELEELLEGKAIVPQRFVLENLTFDTGDARVQPNEMLDDAAEVLREHPDARVRIEGYADGRSSVANQALSQSRADAVKSYLMARGVSATQVQAMGMLELSPLSGDETAAGLARNRRVELVITQR